MENDSSGSAGGDAYPDIRIHISKNGNGFLVSLAPFIDKGTLGAAWEHQLSSPKEVYDSICMAILDRELYRNRPLDESKDDIHVTYSLQMTSDAEESLGPMYAPDLRGAIERCNELTAIMTRRYGD